MLINCPRCGFSQPKDQYCASCGVNIEKFIPERQKLLKKIFSSSLVQVTLLVLILAPLAYYALRGANDNQGTQLTARSLQKNSLGTPNVSTVGASTAAEVPGSATRGSVVIEAQEELQKDLIAGEPPTPTNAPHNGADEPVAASGLASNAQPGAARASGSATTQVAYSLTAYEVNREILDYWASVIPKGQAASAETVSGEIDLALLKRPPLPVILKTENKKAETKKDSSTLYGMPTPGTDGAPDTSFLGLYVTLNIDTADANQAAGHVRLQMRDAHAFDSITLPVQLGKNKVFIFHWKNDLLRLQNETALANLPPFQILQSTKYLAQKSDLVFVIEPFF